MTDSVMQPVLVTRVQRGELVTKDAAPYWVLACCELQNVGWWCDTHQLAEATREAMAQHCKAPGEHRVARWCPKHSFEEPEKRGAA